MEIEYANEVEIVEVSKEVSSLADMFARLNLDGVGDLIVL